MRYYLNFFEDFCHNKEIILSFNEGELPRKMKTCQYRGKFIVFEGIDGSGKSYQGERLRDYLRKRGWKIFFTNEPGVSSYGREARKMIKSKKVKSILDLQKLFIKDRREHLKKEVIPNLKKGNIVICDRYFLSTLAYGGLSLDVDEMLRLHNKILGKYFIIPDITFILDIESREAVRRIISRNKGGDARAEFFERADRLAKIRKNYLDLAKRFPNSNIKIINSKKSKNQTFKEIKKETDVFLQEGL